MVTWNKSACAWLGVNFGKNAPYCCETSVEKLSWKRWWKGGVTVAVNENGVVDMDCLCSMDETMLRKWAIPRVVWTSLHILRGFLLVSHTYEHKLSNLVSTNSNTIETRFHFPPITLSEQTNKHVHRYTHTQTTYFRLQYIKMRRKLEGNRRRCSTEIKHYFPIIVFCDGKCTGCPT